MDIWHQIFIVHQILSNTFPGLSFTAWSIHRRPDHYQPTGCIVEQSAQPLLHKSATKHQNIEFGKIKNNKEEQT